jgi:hypothetical protein
MKYPQVFGALYIMSPCCMSARAAPPADMAKKLEAITTREEAANAPLAMIDQYISNLRHYNAIAIDVGDQDGLNVDTKTLHAVLDSYGIKNSFELYSGTHTSAVADRFQNHVLPFFSQHLTFESK